jgi:hypothetical protein
MVAQLFPSTPNEAQLLQIIIYSQKMLQDHKMNNNFMLLRKNPNWKMNQNLREELNVMKLEIERLKSILKPSETISQEDEISDNDLADDTKWVRVENNKNKKKLDDRKSPSKLCRMRLQQVLLLHICNQNKHINHRLL